MPWLEVNVGQGEVDVDVDVDRVIKNVLRIIIVTRHGQDITLGKLQ